jgi:hypothetical protein
MDWPQILGVLGLGALTTGVAAGMAKAPEFGASTGLSIPSLPEAFGLAYAEGDPERIARADVGTGDMAALLPVTMPSKRVGDAPRLLRTARGAET